MVSFRSTPFSINKTLALVGSLVIREPFAVQILQARKTIFEAINVAVFSISAQLSGLASSRE